MNSERVEEILFQVLRIGLIAARNSAFSLDDRSSALIREQEWLSLCHSLPSVLIGECGSKAVRYFCEGDGKMFVAKYPEKTATDYIQIVSLLRELVREQEEVPLEIPKGLKQP